LTKTPPIKEAGELFTSKLGLTFQLKRHHFIQVIYLMVLTLKDNRFMKDLFNIQGYVRIKCTATIYSEYFESTELQLLGLGLGEKALESRMNGKYKETLCLLISSNHDNKFPLSQLYVDIRNQQQSVIVSKLFSSVKSFITVFLSIS